LAITGRRHTIRKLENKREEIPHISIMDDPSVQGITLLNAYHLMKGKVDSLMFHREVTH
jgi:hypothetical protein